MIDILTPFVTQRLGPSVDHTCAVTLALFKLVFLLKVGPTFQVQQPSQYKEKISRKKREFENNCHINKSEICPSESQ